MLRQQYWILFVLITDLAEIRLKHVRITIDLQQFDDFGNGLIEITLGTITLLIFFRNLFKILKKVHFTFLCFYPISNVQYRNMVVAET